MADDLLDQSDLDLLNSVDGEEEQGGEESEVQGEGEEEQETEVPEAEEESEVEEPQEEEKEEEEDFDVQNVKYSDIKKAYPDLFKKFPGLKHAFFREGRYSQLFPSVEDAEVAFDKASVLDKLEDFVQAGDPEPIVKSIADPQVREAFVKNFLPTLQKLDSQLFVKVTEPILRNAIAFVAREAGRQGNKNLEIASQYVSKFLFENEKIEAQPLEVKTIDRTVDQQHYQEFDADVKESVIREMHKAILESLPKNITKFTANSMVREMGDKVTAAMAQDSNHLRLMEQLWNRAVTERFSRASRARLINAGLARVRAVLPAIASKVKAEALGVPKPVKKPGLPATNKNTVSSLGKVDRSKIDWSKTSDMDVLNGKITLKGK